MNYNDINYTQQSINNALINKDERAATIASDTSSMSTFDKSFQQATTFNSGVLIPILLQQVNPKDIYEIDINSLIRLSAQAATPFMNINYDVNFFFVPLEQLDDDFKEVFGETKDYGYNKTPLNIPLLDFDLVNHKIKYNENDLANYFNIPINRNFYKEKLNLYPFLAYGKIWNEWYRDQNYQGTIDISTWNNATRTLKATTYNPNMSFYESIIYGKGLAPTSKLPSYFTTLLPYQQKGESINLSSDFMVRSYGRDDPKYNPSKDTILVNNVDNIYGNSNVKFLTLADGNGEGPLTIFQPDNDLNGYRSLGIPKFNMTIEGDGFNITSLRNSIVLQHLMENWALCGSRYVEQLKSIWGIEINPLQINRTELIGGFNDTLRFSNVVQTSQSTNESQLGNIASNLYNTLNLPKISYAASQHGLIIGLLTCRTQINNGGQGLPKYFSYNDMYDFHNPLFNGISEQPLKSKELYFKDFSADSETKNNQVLGYNEPFIEYKYNIDNANGFFSLNSELSLFQHFLFGEKYDDTPILNDEWMRFNPNIIQNTLFTTNEGTTEFYHQFISIFTFNIKYTTTQPLFNKPSLSRI